MRSPAPLEGLTFGHLLVVGERPRDERTGRRRLAVRTMCCEELRVVGHAQLIQARARASGMCRRCRALLGLATHHRPWTAAALEQREQRARRRAAAHEVRRSVRARELARVGIEPGAFLYEVGIFEDTPSTIRTLADFLGALSTGDVDGLYGQMRADYAGERSAA